MNKEELPLFYNAIPSFVRVEGNPLLGNVKTKKRVALVAQGGGQRGIFTAGVLDSFIKQGFDPFELYIGTSAGALNISCYLAKNYGFAYRFITQFTTRSEFFNLLKYVRRRKSMDLSWALDAQDYSNPEVFDKEQARRLLQYRKAYACATEVSTLNPHFFPIFGDNWLNVLKATSAIPLLYGDPVEIEGKRYVDGGVSSAIPVREAFNRGADIIVVIRTETTEEDKKPISSGVLERLRSKVEQHLPDYLSKLNLESRMAKLSQYHTLLSQKLQGLQSKYAEDAWMQLKTKMPERFRNGGRWLFGGDSIYRLQALTGEKINLDMVNMLTRHYQSYQECIRFLQAPPSRIQIIEICPSQPLASSPLLSKNSELIQDYDNGVMIGDKFIQHFSDPLNEISSLDIL